MLLSDLLHVKLHNISFWEAGFERGRHTGQCVICLDDNKLWFLKYEGGCGTRNCVIASIGAEMTEKFLQLLVLSALLWWPIQWNTVKPTLWETQKELTVDVAFWLQYGK